MKLVTAAKLLLITSLKQHISAQYEVSLIKDSYNLGCKNDIAFTGAFELADGSTCDSCSFCDGTNLVDFFNPKIESNCVNCTIEQSSCNTFSIMTTFQQGWKMKFNKIRSSNKEAKYDPKVVVIRGSNDTKTWEDLYITKGISDIFTTRREEVKEVILNNNKVYKVYKVSYTMKEDMKLYVGPYGIVEAYTRQCTADLHNAITKETIIPYETMTPTSHPSNMPSITPTDQPSVPTGYDFETNDQLKTAVNLWTSNKQEAIKQYGEIQDWNVGKVTNMSRLFYLKKNFNEDLSRWDVASVTDMSWMFEHAEAFNSDISHWNVASVRNMHSMFARAFVFNSDLSNWNVASVSDMSGMFKYVKAFDHTLCWGDLSGANTNNMFKYAKGGSVDPNC